MHHQFQESPATCSLSGAAAPESGAAFSVETGAPLLPPSLRKDAVPLFQSCFQAEDTPSRESRSEDFLDYESRTG